MENSFIKYTLYRFKLPAWYIVTIVISNKYQQGDYLQKPIGFIKSSFQMPQYYR
jgi:hypothetical protein